MNTENFSGNNDDDTDDEKEQKTVLTIEGVYLNRSRLRSRTYFGYTTYRSRSISALLREYISVIQKQ